MEHIQTIDEQSRAGYGLPSWAIRPGVMFPEWDAVSSERARVALGAILEAFGAENCWKDFRADEDRVLDATLRSYLSVGRAPTLTELVKATDLDIIDVRKFLQQLSGRDRIVLGSDEESITGAYPFTENKTEHRVRVGDRTIYAMCAVDALGVGYMCDTDVTIESSCRATGLPIRITTKTRAHSLNH